MVRGTMSTKDKSFSLACKIIVITVLLREMRNPSRSVG
jgi:hypothetical protein